MERIQLGYGHNGCGVEYDPTSTVILTEHALTKEPAPEQELLRQALAQPIASERLSCLVKPGEKIAVLVSDVTRPCPTARMLPALLEELQRAGVNDADVRFIFGIGGHRLQTEQEQIGLVGEDVYRRFECGNIDRADFATVGTTRRGTVVEVYRPVVAADWRIYLGNIEYHWFVGYSGGAKALLPGVCSEKTITANHSWMVEDAATAGRIEGNPVREDIEEGAALAGQAFLFNVVLDGEFRIVDAVAGDVTIAHRQGCHKVDELYRVPLAQRGDIVLASAGGLPKDINLYQAQKALDNAEHAVRDGGMLILLAECAEGVGSQAFVEWMTRGDPPDQILARIKTKFVLGGHKAISIAKMQKRGVQIALVSAMDPALVRAMGFESYATVPAALAVARARLGATARMVIMPHAGSTLPVSEH